jgi:hypothetical protein
MIRRIRGLDFHLRPFGTPPPAEDTGILHQHITQSRIAAPFRLVADGIHFAEVFSFDDYIIHKYPVKSKK